jgi:tRNA-splicing ligase RtcB
MLSKKDFIKINDYLWEIPKSLRPDMRVPARVYASEKMLEEIFRDKSLEQLINLCTLPGIQKYGLAMPDCHEGYASPIGGVAAIETSQGIISPGMQGYDINCGMKILKSEYKAEELKPYLEKLASEIQKEVPSGVGKGRQIKLSIEQINKILEGGVKYLVEKGYGEKEDVENCEGEGTLPWARADAVSLRAKERGRGQVGTLGSGNHFLEIQRVVEIFDKEVAEIFGLFEDQLVIMIHCGSRGLGHQVCTDYLREFMPLMERKYKIKVPDKEFACVPFKSPEGQRALGASASAANFAWANRQMISYFVRKAWKKVIGRGELKPLYDVAHNIIKIENYNIQGKKVEVAVHRKGSTRAFPPGHPEIPEKYKEVGQPVLIPGSMGTASYVLVGQEEGEEAFFSTCFPGDTRILTNRGVFTFSDLYKRFNENEGEFLVPSFNEKTYQIEWKPIMKVMKRRAPVIEISISQSGKETQNKLRVTSDHGFITILGPKFVKRKISEIINEKKMICLLDNLPGFNCQFIDPQLAYLVGAIATDGSVYLGPGTGQYPYRGRKITFIQKKTPQKLNFINYVQSSFQNIFNTSLREYRTRTEGGYIRGKLMQGTATDFVCTQVEPIQQLSFIQENLISWVLSLSKESVFNFLAGIIDGDGTWHPDHKVIEIFNSDENVVGAIVMACLRLGILPYMSKQRDNCYIIQISERIDEITKYTKRVKSEPHLRKYGTKMFSIRQLFKGVSDLKWPFLQKAKRNSLMSKEIILRHLNTLSNQKRYSTIKHLIEKVISSPLRMQRVKKIKDLDERDVFNITVKDNHNYIVLTDLFSPVLVANCHGAGRTMSRKAATRRISGYQVVKELESKGIVVKCRSFKGIAEEAPQAYKDINEVVEVVDKAGLSKKVAKLRPLAVIKGE